MGVLKLRKPGHKEWHCLCAPVNTSVYTHQIDVFKVESGIHDSPSETILRNSRSQTRSGASMLPGALPPSEAVGRGPPVSSRLSHWPAPRDLGAAMSSPATTRCTRYVPHIKGLQPPQIPPCLLPCLSVCFSPAAVSHMSSFILPSPNKLLTPNLLPGINSQGLLAWHSLAKAPHSSPVVYPIPSSRTSYSTGKLREYPCLSLPLRHS